MTGIEPVSGIHNHKQPFHTISTICRVDGATNENLTRITVRFGKDYRSHIAGLSQPSLSPNQPLQLGSVNVRLPYKPLTSIALTDTYVHDHMR